MAHIALAHLHTIIKLITFIARFFHRVACRIREGALAPFLPAFQCSAGLFGLAFLCPILAPDAYHLPIFVSGWSRLILFTGLVLLLFRGLLSLEKPCHPSFVEPFWREPHLLRIFQVLAGITIFLAFACDWIRTLY